MIYYKSSRGDPKLYSFSQALLKGIAEDGGLLVPEKIPQIDLQQLQLLKTKTYQEKAAFLFNLFEIDFLAEEVSKIVSQAYSSNFDDKKIAPLIHLKDNQYLLELWHGPTAAFKDMALQIMPLFFEAAIKKNKSQKYLILAATSGDTGKAALEGFKDRDNISIIVFYPDSLVSELQKLQMTTQEGVNVKVYAVKTDFDGVQKLVKEIFNDREFNTQLENKYQTILSSANSINWGRLMPQIIYHISGYLDLVNKKIINFGDQIDIAVPTGNFGNILAAFYAKKMGLPIRKLICASNENNVLSEFLTTGIYDIKNRKLIKTPSPSMDILVASNIERLLYVIADNSKKVLTWMKQLKNDGRFEVDEATKIVLRREFYADYVSNENCLNRIKQVFDETKYIMDPHTSVAQFVAQKYLEEVGSALPIIICSTAHWAKFAKFIYQSLLPSEELPSDEFKANNLIYNLSPEIFVPNSLRFLSQKKAIHTEVINSKEDLVKRLIKSFAASPIVAQETCL